MILAVHANGCRYTVVTTSKGIERMKDTEFLQFIHDRLQYQHNENPNYDYMHKLRAVIKD